MPVVICLERRPYGWRPLNERDDDLSREFPVGTRVKAAITRGKSLDMLAFYWALVEFVAKATGYTKVALSDELLIRTGTVHALKFKNGEVHAVPKSIAGMGHVDFTEYVDAAIEMLCREYIGQMARGDLMARVEQMVGISYAEAARKNNGGQEGRTRVDVASEAAQKRELA